MFREAHPIKHPMTVAVKDLPHESSGAPLHRSGNVPVSTEVDPLWKTLSVPMADGPRAHRANQWAVLGLVTLGVAVLACSLGGCGGNTTSRGLSTRTSSTGPTWQPPAGYQASATEVVFSSAQKGWLAVTLTPSSTKQQNMGALFDSSDAGQRWSLVWQGVGVPGQVVPVNGQTAYFSLESCLDQGAKCTSRVDRLTAGRRAQNAQAQVVTAAQPVTLYGAPLVMGWAGRSAGMVAVPGDGCNDGQPPKGTVPAPCTTRLEVTDDGGHHWRSVLNLRGRVLGIAHQGERQWWLQQGILSSSARTFRPASEVTWSSADAGAHWRVQGGIGSQALGPQFLGPRASGFLYAHGANLWTSVTDQDSCAMHGCATAALWHSPDAGRTWVNVPLPATASQDCSPNANLPLALAPSGQPVISLGTNLAACPPPGSVTLARNGDQWRPVGTWALVQATSLAWPSNAEGFAVAGGALARTTDGGTRWAQVWPALSPSGPLAALSARSAVGAGDLIDPGLVLRTGDAGSTWAPEADLGGDVVHLSFYAACGVASVVGPSTGHWSLEASKDGGRHWDRANGPPLPTSPVEGPSGVIGIWAGDCSHWLVLSSPGAGIYDPSSGVSPVQVWVTADAGKSWAKAGNVPLLRYGTVSGAVFALGPSGQWRGLVTDGGKWPEITQDGARSWRTVTAVPDFEVGQALGAHSIFVAWQTQAQGWEMASSAHAGQHWRRFPLPGPLPTGELGQQSSLVFANPSDGWWSTSGRLWRTTDGGRQWAEVS